MNAKDAKAITDEFVPYSYKPLVYVESGKFLHNIYSSVQQAAQSGYYKFSTQAPSLDIYSAVLKDLDDKGYTADIESGILTVSWENA